MIKTVNITHIEGVLYNHSLEMKVTGPKSKAPGTNYIRGNIEIATDDARINIVPVNFTYVTEKTKSGGENATFKVLKDIIDGTHSSIMSNSNQAPVKLRIDSAIGLNEFFTTRNGAEEFVSAKRNEGGFVHVTNELNPKEAARSSFKCDMLITNVISKEEDVEKNLPAKVTIKGAVFNFRNELLPVEFSVINPQGMAYFEGLEVSSSTPIFTQVWGVQVSETVVKTTVTESAFGEADVRETKSSRKDYVVTGARPEPYDWDSDESMTVAELKELMAKRETYKASIKTRNEEWKAKKAAEGNAFGTPTVSANTDFKF